MATLLAICQWVPGSPSALGWMAAAGRRKPDVPLVTRCLSLHHLIVALNLNPPEFHNWDSSSNLQKKYTSYYIYIHTHIVHPFSGFHIHCAGCFPSFFLYLKDSESFNMRGFSLPTARDPDQGVKKLQFLASFAWYHEEATGWRMDTLEKPYRIIPGTGISWKPK